MSSTGLGKEDRSDVVYQSLMKRTLHDDVVCKSFIMRQNLSEI